VRLLTTVEFAGWFGALDDRTAEDVATTLDVIEQLGAEREPPGSSEWLTWYEAPELSERLRGFGTRGPMNPAVARFFDEWGAFNGYARRVVKQLQSPTFAGRLSALEPRDAERVTDAIARIKKTTTRRRLAFSDYAVLHRLGLRPPTPAQAAQLAAFADVEELRAAYLGALAAAGFAVVDLPARSSALREIASRVPAPGFRLLYGIDAARARGLVVLGEPMGRTFYGDSVRSAERVWAEFLAGELRASQPRRTR
jgi:hypothetical protein